MEKYYQLSHLILQLLVLYKSFLTCLVFKLIKDFLSYLSSKLTAIQPFEFLFLLKLLWKWMVKSSGFSPRIACSNFCKIRLTIMKALDRENIFFILKDLRCVGDGRRWRCYQKIVLYRFLKYYRMLEHSSNNKFNDSWSIFS